MKTRNGLCGNMDAQAWAKEFVAAVKKNPDIATDEGTMIGWFANAIMAGYDTAQNRKSEKEEETATVL